jgi:hypothetical protein
MKYKAIPLILLSLFLAACASVVRNPVPEADHLDVTVLGRSDFRQWGDGRNIRTLPETTGQEDLEKNYGGIMHGEHNYLIISGGGAKGAYGAGVLKAWSEQGSRPEFTLVTGVSTGALIAPFAFLGRDYDAALEQVYTTMDSHQIFDRRGVFSIISGDSIADTSPLKRKIEQVINDDMVAALGQEFQTGRTLLIGTTNIDAGRPVVWNITRIAASGLPGAAKLIRQILLASASIPGAFPPVYIEVETADGRTFDEMHVDGGVTSQMFFYPASIDWDKLMENLDVRGTPTIHLIRNAYLSPEYEVTKPRLLPISGRTINSLIRTQGIGDYYRIWTLADRDGLNLMATWIPDEARETIGVIASETFDPKYMRALFDYGYQRTLDGDTWRDTSDMLEKGER